MPAGAKPASAAKATSAARTRANAAAASATASSLLTAKTMCGTRSSWARSAWRQDLEWLHRGERPRGEVELGRIDEDDGGVAARGGGHHVPGVLLVTGRVGDDELALARREVAVGDVDRDALLALGLEAVGEVCEGYRLAAGLRLERVELVGEYGAAVEEEPADQRALAVIDRACREEAKRPARGRHGVVVAQGESHQK